MNAAQAAIEAKTVAARLVGKEFQPLVDKILEIDLLEVAISGWKKYRALQKFRDSEKYPPHVVGNLSLFEHKLKSTHQPRIDITVNDTPLPPIELDFQLALEVEGVTLLVQGGRIREVAAGQCRLRATLEYQDTTLWEQRTDTFSFPGRVSLGDGIPIPAA